MRDRASRWSRESHCPRARASGLRAGWRRRSGPTTRLRSTSRTRWPPAGTRAGARRPSCWRARPPAWWPSSSAGVSSSTAIRMEACRSPWRAATPAGGRGKREGRGGGARAPRRRVVHAGGAGTGRRITERLAATAAADDRIEVIEHTSMVALWSDGERCHGVITDTGPIRARATILATGGAAALWARTTNPWGAIGAGTVIAHAAGAELADLELCQFHPTALAA